MKEMDLFNSKPRHVFCVDDTEAEDSLNDYGEHKLIAGKIYHLKALEMDNGNPVVKLNEFSDMLFNSTRFAEVQYSEGSSDFHIMDPSIRHVACINNHDMSWLFKDNASKHLRIGKIYHMSEVEICDRYALVRLFEILKLQFNSMHFSELRIFKNYA